MDCHIAAQPVDAGLNMQNSRNIDELLGLFKGKKRIPLDLLVEVLDNIPPSASLRGLGLMEDTHFLAADLNGYISSGINAIEAKGRSVLDTEPFVEVHTNVMRYIGDRGYCTQPISMYWKSFAVGVLIRTVGLHVNLADLRLRGGDATYLELMTIEPDMSHSSQPFLQVQGLQGSAESFLNMNWSVAAGYQSSGDPCQQMGSPYMASGPSVFNPSHSLHGSLAASPHPGSFPAPEACPSPAPPSQVGSPSPHSLYSATPAFDARFQSTSPQHTPFPNQDGGHISVSNTPHSPVGSLLSLHSLHLAPSLSSVPAQSLSPGPNGPPRRHMSATPDYHQSLSPTPSGPMSPSPDYRQPRSPAPSMAFLPAFSHGFVPNSPGRSFEQAGALQQPYDDGMDFASPCSSIPDSLFGPIPDVDAVAPVRQSPYDHGPPIDLISPLPSMGRPTASDRRG